MSVRFGAMHSSPYAKFDLCLGVRSGPSNRAKMRWHTASMKRSLTVWPRTASDQVLMLRSCKLGEGRRRQVGCRVRRSNHGLVHTVRLTPYPSLILEKT